jgi:hypothetical protein
MDLQDVSKFSISILNQILSFQGDGYTDFSIKTGRELNPDTQELQECVVVDMTRNDESKTVNFFYA